MRNEIEATKRGIEEIRASHPNTAREMDAAGIVAEYVLVSKKSYALAYEYRTGQIVRATGSKCLVDRFARNTN